MKIKKTFSAIAITLATTLLSCMPITALADEKSESINFENYKVGDVINYGGYKIEFVPLDELPSGVVPLNTGDMSIDDAVKMVDETIENIDNSLESGNQNISKSNNLEASPNLQNIASATADKLINSSTSKQITTYLAGPTVNIGIDYSYYYNYYGSYYNSCSRAYGFLTGFTTWFSWDNQGWSSNISNGGSSLNVQVNGVLNTYLVTSGGGLGVKLSSEYKTFNTTFTL